MSKKVTGGGQHLTGARLQQLRARQRINLAKACGIIDGGLRVEMIERVNADVNAIPSVLAQINAMWAAADALDAELEYEAGR